MNEKDNERSKTIELDLLKKIQRIKIQKNNPSNNNISYQIIKMITQYILHQYIIIDLIKLGVFPNYSKNISKLQFNNKKNILNFIIIINYVFNVMKNTLQTIVLKVNVNKNFNFKPKNKY